jgi:hypothetical protein
MLKTKRLENQLIFGLQDVGSKKNTKRPKQENQSSLMPEGGDPKRKRNPIKNGQSRDSGTGNHENSNLKMKTSKQK